MIVENFNIQGEERVQEFKEFLTHNMNSSSLRAPISSRYSNHSYSVSLSCNLKDLLQLETLFNKWNYLDNKEIADQSENKLVAGLRKLFKTSS